MKKTQKYFFSILLFTTFYSFINLDSIPKIILWVWDRTEDLSFVDSKTGIAYLSKTICFYDNNIMIKHRLNPFKFTNGAYLIAVIRIESYLSKNKINDFSNKFLSKIISEITILCKIKEVKAIQIDFDAKNSERSLYKELLVTLRKKLPYSMPISITALSSWCLYDDWISELEIDEAVPMLFRMGKDKIQILNHIKQGKDFYSCLCRKSVGISTDEQIKRLLPKKRTYIFNPKSWSKNDYDSIIKEVMKWQ